jgi:4-hydroxybenzoate polyprenyltransferase
MRKRVLLTISYFINKYVFALFTRGLAVMGTYPLLEFKHASFVVDLTVLGFAFTTQFGMHAHDKSQALRGSLSVR